MAFDVSFFLALAVVLGFKHAFDADHLVAVSNLLTRRQRVDHAVGLASSWAVGHLVTAAAVSAVVYFFADTFLPSITARLEILVPIMLLVVGIFGLLAERRRMHVHKHDHDGRAHVHVHTHWRSKRHEHGAMAGIGVVHGLASNDELLLVLLVGLGAASWWHVLLGVAFFSLGVLVGMVLFAAAIHAFDGPVSRRFGWNWVPTALTVTFSVASIAYAVYLLAGGEGWNLFEGWIDDSRQTRAT